MNGQCCSPILKANIAYRGIEVHRITGVIGRDELIEGTRRELAKGKHVLLTGAVGIGKSTVLGAALAVVPAKRVVIRLYDHQAKGQFVEMARQMLTLGLIEAKALDLPEKYQTMTPAQIPWEGIKRQVSRLSIRDLSQAIIPALAACPEKPLIAVDDLTFLTPTQQAFWLAVFDHAQIVGCASEKKKGLRKLWWKMREIALPALVPETSKAIVQTYITRKGVLIESPELYVSHVVKQAGGNPQAIEDMLDESAKERVIDKRKVREMRHEAGVRYLDFTPVILVSGASIIAMRYVAMGLGDRMLYVMAGIGAALFLSFRLLLMRAVGR
jgi:energy-coupling factor transporter ATP-binding protein EcfA2